MPPPNARDGLTALPADAVARFRGDVDRLTHAAGLHGEPGLALAVSGGPDSMAMLALAAAAFPGRVACATVDHDLRIGSAVEAAMVGEVCAAIGVDHHVLHPAAPIAGSSIQMRAREARYAALTAWAGGRALLTAHHADDQAETLLMRLNRASGLSGLAGIRRFRIDGATPILRPLLDWRRAELRAIVVASGWPVVDDPSNDDERHDRTRIRALLAAHPALDAAALAASARHVAEADEALAEQARREWAARWDGKAQTLALEGLPRELRRRLVRLAIAAVRAREGLAQPAFSPATNVEPLLDAIDAGRSAVQGGVLLRPAGGSWHFSPAPQRRSR